MSVCSCFICENSQVVSSSDAEHFDANNGVGVGYVYPSAGGSSSSSSNYEASQVNDESLFVLIHGLSILMLSSNECSRLLVAVVVQ